MVGRLKDRVVQGEDGGCWDRHLMKRGVEECGQPGAGARQAEGS